jgi:hypothetical protein
MKELDPSLLRQVPVAKDWSRNLAKRSMSKSDPMLNLDIESMVRSEDCAQMLVMWHIVQKNVLAVDGHLVARLGAKLETHTHQWRLTASK